MNASEITAADEAELGLVFHLKPYSARPMLGRHTGDMDGTLSLSIQDYSSDGENNHNQLVCPGWTFRRNLVFMLLGLAAPLVTVEGNRSCKVRSHQK